ncbi:hypothetical protein COXBURSA331_A1482 [Coxiella burnetii RSA 331]|nr:hypothetical protein COXBURSA331_A1482 [Coxiella burnetii RSA 331]
MDWVCAWRSLARPAIILLKILPIDSGEIWLALSLKRINESLMR